MTITDDHGTDEWETAAVEQYSVEFDPETESLVAIVVRAIASIRGVKPADLPPLNDTIDAEALECARRLSNSEAFDGGTLSFTYNAVSVTVDFAGEVQLRRND